MQISILNGIYTDRDANFRSSYPRNLIPVPKQQGISQGYLRPADGIDLFAVGAGVDRGGINWNGICYRASGEYLIKVHAGGSIEIIGFISNDGLPCSFDYSFDRLCIVSAKKMFYLQGGVCCWLSRCFSSGLCCRFSCGFCCHLCGGRWCRLLCCSDS